MTESIQRLVAALRDELQQYGEMLALLEREQELVMQRAAADLLETVTSIQGHASVVQQARQYRDQCRSELAKVLKQPADTPLVNLIGLLPNNYQLLVEALVRENNELLTRVQQRARQNHLLLSRSLELMQRFIATLFPSRDGQVYDEQGQRPSRPQPLAPLYEAVG